MENNEWLPRIQQLGNGAQAQMSLAYSCFTNGDHDGTIRHCAISKELNPSFYRPYLLLGWTYLNLGKLPQALHEAEATLQIDDTLVEAILLAAIVLMEMDRDEEAISQCYVGLGHDDQYAFFYYLLGKLLNRQEKYQEASVELEKAVRLNPQLADARQLLALNYLKIDEEEKALREVELVLQANPLSARMRIMLGSMYLEHGDYPSALAEFRGATTINPRMADAHYQAGVSYYRLERFPLAILELRIALSIHPNYPEAQHLLGKVYVHYSRYRLAIEFFLAALRLKVKFPEARCDLGDAYVLNRQFRAAIETYREAALSGDIPCEHAERLVGEKKLVEAVIAYRSALQLADLHIPGLADGEETGVVPEGKEQRRQERFNVQLAVNIQDRDGEERKATAETVDISQQGLLIESEQALAEGSVVTLTLSVPGSEEQIPVTGSIVRVQSSSKNNERKRFGIQLSGSGAANSGWDDFFSEFLMS